MATKLVKDKAVELKVAKAQATAKAFLLFFEGEDKPFFVARRVASEDGYIHKSQFIGKTLSVTPTQSTTSGGWLGQIDLPLQDISSNRMLAKRQEIADKYATAALYAKEMDEEA